MYPLNELFCADRYAFTPLIDDSDDEEIEEFIASSNIGTSFIIVALSENTVNMFLLFR